MASRRAKAYAVQTRAMTLNTTVHATVAISVIFHANLASKTMIANTMLASPRGPNQTTNNDFRNRHPRAPSRQSATGSIRGQAQNSIEDQSWIGMGQQPPHHV